MTDSGSYDLHGSHRSVSAEIQRLAAQARLGWAKEARTLSWFGVQDGMSVLELGSGPGFITAQCLELLPTSPITSLEIDPSLIAQADQYLSDSDKQRVRFVEGSVMAIPAEANQYDVAYARFLFQHLADPLGAAKEVLRVLKPGGKLIINDIDDELFGVFQPPLPGLALVIERFGQAQAARGGNRHIGRSLWPMLTAAGFQNIDIEVLAGHSGEIGIATYMQHLDPDRMVPLVTNGLLSAEELALFRASYEQFLAAPDAYTLWLGFMVCGEKP